MRMKGSVLDPGVQIPTDIYCNIVSSLQRGCLLQSILDIWEYDSDIIRNQTKEDIIARFNSVTISPTLGHPMNFTDLLGGVKYDDNGRVISATAVKTNWFVHVNFTNIRMNESGNDVGTADWVIL